MTEYYNHSFYNNYASMPYHGNKQSLRDMGHTIYHSAHNYETSIYYHHRQRSRYETTDMQSGSSRRPNARPTTMRPAGRPKATVRSSQPRPATEADRILARIPVGYSLKNWDPTETPIILLGSVFDANSLGKWIYDWTVYHYYPRSPISLVAADLWLLLIKIAGKISSAENHFHRIDTTENREMVQEFLDSGYRIWDRLKKLLKVCEDHMWKAHKRDSSKQSSSNDGGLQSSKHQNKSENGENDQTSPCKDKRAEEGGSKVKDSIDVHTRDQQTSDNESRHVQAVQESIMVKPEAGKPSAQSHAADNDLEDRKRGKQKSRESKGAKRVQLGVSSGIAFVEAIFGRDKELERTEKLMAYMTLWNGRFDANCDEILRPRSVKQTVRRERRSSIELRGYERFRSTTPKARTIDVDSVASQNKTRTRSSTPKRRSIHTDPRAAPRDHNTLEVVEASSTTIVEQSPSPFDSEQQQLDAAKLSNEWESWAPGAKKKKKKKKSMEPVTEDSNSQPEIVEPIKDLEDRGDPSLHEVSLSTQSD